MVFLRVDVVIEGRSCEAQHMEVGNQWTVSEWVSSMGERVQNAIVGGTNQPIKVQLYYKGYEIDRHSTIGQLFDQHDSLTLIARSGSPNHAQKKQGLEGRGVGKKIKKYKKRKQRKRKHREHQKREIQCAEASTSHSQCPIPKQLTLTPIQERMLRIIQFVDNYLLFSLNFRRREFEPLSDIQQYYLDKHGVSLQAGMFQSIIRICPQLYKVASIKCIGTVVKMTQRRSFQQRRLMFVRSILQFQNKPLQESRPYKMSPTLSTTKYKINPISVLYDKQFSRKMEQIILQKQLHREEQARERERLKPKEYRTFAEQTQLFRTLSRINPQRQTFLQQMEKHTGSSRSSILEFIQFVKSKSEYIRQQVWAGGSKLIIDARLYHHVLSIIDDM